MTTSPSGTVPARITDDRITTYGLLLEADRRLARIFEHSLRLEHGLTNVTFEALLRLGRSDGGRMSMSELADQMLLTSGGITRLVDRLASAGLVERLQCPDDRRIQWAHLTDDGWRRLDAALETHLEDLEEHFASHIEPDELPVIVRVLDRIRSTCGGEPGVVAEPK
jgi:DNA-binding MarR family transcriptional regulator